MEQPENMDIDNRQSAGPQDIDRQLPAMSVILPADKPDTIHGVLNHLKKQTIASHLEIVLATPSSSAFEELRATLSDFHSVSFVELRDLSSLGEARALALKAARAPCVFLGETHSFASVPEWAERLVARHREGWSVVVPGFRNANPGKLLSWAGFLLDYGGWMDDQPAGEIEYWPLNNSCCDRAAILESADDLRHALSYGDQLILAMQTAGHRVYLEPTAALSHLNISRWKEWLDENWIGGHLVSRYRSRDWSLTRRWVYVCASPAIAIVLLARVWRPAWRAKQRLGLSSAIMPTLLLGAIAKALGELVGYTHFGTDKASERRMTEYELHKVKYS